MSGIALDIGISYNLKLMWSDTRVTPLWRYFPAMTKRVLVLQTEAKASKALADYFSGTGSLADFEKVLLSANGQFSVIIKKGEDPLFLPQMHFTPTTEESIAINNVSGPAIVISASGMADAGRIKHHLRHNIWREGASIVFVGFQAQGTTGRKIVDGAKKIRLFNEEIAVRMDLPISKIRKILEITRAPVSLETPIGEDGGSRLGDLIKDSGMLSPAEAALNVNLKQKTESALKVLFNYGWPGNVRQLRSAIRRAMKTLAPPDMPQKRPSSRHKRLAIPTAS
jgi:Cft2 family RNA processing exonuclease